MGNPERTLTMLVFRDNVAQLQLGCHASPFVISGICLPAVLKQAQQTK